MVSVDRAVSVEHRLADGARSYSMYAHVTNLSTTARAVSGEVGRGAKLGVVIAWPGPEGVVNSHLHFEIRTFLYT